MNGKVRVAVVSWKLKPIKTDGDFFGHYHDLVSEAHQEGADLVVFPENHTLELLDLARDIDERNVPKFISQFATDIENWTQRISDSSGMIIVGGSCLKETNRGCENVCPIAVPGQPLTLVSKNRLTWYEKMVWKLASGEGIHLPPVDWLGCLLCYDIEFPEAARSLAEQSNFVIANPTFTETSYGFNRVRHCGHARAIENQLFVLQANLTGSLEREPVPSTFGSSAILCPCIEPYPNSGILGETEPNEESVLVRTLDLDQLLNVRQSGDVMNWQDRNPSTWQTHRSQSKDPIS